MQNVLVQIASGDSLRPFGPNVNVHSTPCPSRSFAKNRRGVLENDAKSIAWLRSSYLNLESSYLDLGRDLAKLVYGHDINHVLLLHLGAFSSTILPDALDLLEKKGFKVVPLEEAENDPVYKGDPDVGSRYLGTLLELWTEAKKIKFPPVMEKPYKEIAAICK